MGYSLLGNNIPFLLVRRMESEFEIKFSPRITIEFWLRHIDKKLITKC